MNNKGSFRRCSFWHEILEQDYPASSLIELYLWLDNLWEEVDNENDWKEMQQLKALCYHLLPVPFTNRGGEIQTSEKWTVREANQD